MTQDQLIAQLQQLQERNIRVEREKARENSWTRKILIMVSTYTIMCLVLVSIGNIRRYLDAIVPTLGFMLSTLSFDWVKKRWMKKF